MNRMKEMKREYSLEADQLRNWLVWTSCREDVLLLTQLLLRSTEYLKLGE